MLESCGHACALPAWGRVISELCRSLIIKAVSHWHELFVRTVPASNSHEQLVRMSTYTDANKRRKHKSAGNHIGNFGRHYTWHVDVWWLWFCCKYHDISSTKSSAIAFTACKPQEQAFATTHATQMLLYRISQQQRYTVQKHLCRVCCCKGLFPRFTSCKYNSRWLSCGISVVRQHQGDFCHLFQELQRDHESRFVRVCNRQSLLERITRAN